MIKANKEIYYLDMVYKLTNSIDVNLLQPMIYHIIRKLCLKPKLIHFITLILLKQQRSIINKLFMKKIIKIKYLNMVLERFLGNKN